MVGRGSSSWPGGVEAADRAAALRDRLLLLGADDAQAFAAVLECYRVTDVNEPGDRGRELAQALLHASEVPLEIAQRAAEVVELAAGAALEGRRPMRPDAVAAVIMADAATRAASLLVGGNLASLPFGSEPGEVPRLLDEARVAQERAATHAARAAGPERSRDGWG